MGYACGLTGSLAAGVPRPIGAKLGFCLKKMILPGPALSPSTAPSTIAYVGLEGLFYSADRGGKVDPYAGIAWGGASFTNGSMGEWGANRPPFPFPFHFNNLQVPRAGSLLGIPLAFPRCIGSQSGIPYKRKLYMTNQTNTPQNVPTTPLARETGILDRGQAAQDLQEALQKLASIPALSALLDDLEGVLRKYRGGTRPTAAPHPVAPPPQAGASTMHEAATAVLKTFPNPVKTGDLLPAVRKAWGRLDSKQLYWALEYRRRSVGDVDRKPGGLWFVRTDH